MFSIAVLGWDNASKTLLRRALRGIGSGVSYIFRLVQRTRLSCFYDTMGNDVSIEPGTADTLQCSFRTDESRLPHLQRDLHCNRSHEAHGPRKVLARTALLLGVLVGKESRAASARLVRPERRVIVLRSAQLPPPTLRAPHAVPGWI